MRNEAAPNKKILLSVVAMDWCDLGVAYTKMLTDSVEVLCWDTGDPYPEHIEEWQGDWIISYRGDFIFPERIYQRAKKGAINFHPAPPRYRGLGSQHYAIDHGDTTYGSTCHHLAKSVDTGPIIDVEEFDIAPDETASSLRFQVGAHCLTQYLRILTQYILPDRELPVSQQIWGEKLYTQAAIDAWLSETTAKRPDAACVQ